MKRLMGAAGSAWKRGFLSALCGWVLAPHAGAQVAVQDGFESGSFSPAWSVTSGVTIQSDGGALNSARYARLAAASQTTGRILEGSFLGVAPEGAADFYVDLYFRVQTTTDRQFNLHLAFSSAAVVNLRYQNGWAVYDTAWRAVPGLGSVTPGQWHRLRITGQGWGAPGAHYNLALSDAGATNFTSSASNLAIYQSGNPQTTLARLFRFTTEFGSSPGFDVDEITAGVTAAPVIDTNAVVNIRGTYPHLAVFSGDGEIGMGAVVPWADKLWFLTYPPHAPGASGDKLWMVDSNLVLTAHPQSVGGTHANRMIHRESQQLNIGPYFINATGGVRVVSRSAMPGRLTGSARHLSDPANQIYIATMEEGFYAVDVNTLAVTVLKPDAQTQTSGAGLLMPGNHGKGLYSGQGRLIYANNGEAGWSIGSNFSGFNNPAGWLAEISGTDFTNDWVTLERKNFTEVTGPGGIYGNTNANDPVWATGWDKRSVILRLLDQGTWHTYRLPKGSYTHDSFQGWYTEWPRIREIKDDLLLMHMHGMFYRFPKSFSRANAGGLEPICTYLKMPVDYCWWNGQLVMGRDDASTTGGNRWAGQSHSAPWFGQLKDLEEWGPPAGFGGPWKEDSVTAGTPSEPFLVRGFQKRVLHLKQGGAASLSLALQLDLDGSGSWTTWTNLILPASGYRWITLPANLDATWVRLVPDTAASQVTAFFHLANPPIAPLPALFEGLAEIGRTNLASDGIIRPREGDARFLQFAANLHGANGGAPEAAYYEIGGALQLNRRTNAAAEDALRTNYGLATADFTVDAASVLVIEGGNRFRLPKTHPAYDTAFASGWPRGIREVVTERDLFQAHGTFYELPKAGSGGFRRVRPVASHNKCISDFASWRGMLVLAGVSNETVTNSQVIRAADSRAALWFGNVDDLWRLGAPCGVGGPWKNTAVSAGVASDPYLMWGYEDKALELSHGHSQPVTFIVEVDFAADNTWAEYARFTVQPGETLRHIFPEGYSAHWVRLKTDASATVSATFAYGQPALRIGTAARRADGVFRLSFSGPVGQGYTLKAAANLGGAPGTWELLRTGVFGAGAERYEDTSAPNWPQRFYLISIP